MGWDKVTVTVAGMSRWISLCAYIICAFAFMFVELLLRRVELAAGRALHDPGFTPLLVVLVRLQCLAENRWYTLTRDVSAEHCMHAEQEQAGHSAITTSQNRISTEWLTVPEQVLSRFERRRHFEHVSARAWHAASLATPTYFTVQYGRRK